ncbi:MAG: hypothetical protein IJ113_06040 [Eggerthellaceae bacterium]|nr:hypothetical protein [Eggerthellaceae bacterium]
MASAFVRINEKKLKKLVDESSGTGALLQGRVDSVEGKANSSSSGFRTGIYHRPGGEKVGNTQPTYKGNVTKGRKGYVGIVYTGNYSAMKDNYENNTLLKSL